VTVVLVLVGVRSTAVSLWVVVVVVGVGSFTTVVQDERTRAQAGITGINRISFFIIGLVANKLDSTEVPAADGLEAKISQARAIGTSRPVLLER
jgi:hypothetical protein